MSLLTSLLFLLCLLLNYKGIRGITSVENTNNRPHPKLRHFIYIPKDGIAGQASWSVASWGGWVSIVLVVINEVASPVD